MEQQSDVSGFLNPGGKNATLVYILFLVGFLIGLTSLIGVIFAYLNRGKSESWVDSHYTFQIRTFWISLAVGIVGAVRYPDRFSDPVCAGDLGDCAQHQRHAIVFAGSPHSQSANTGVLTRQTRAAGMSPGSARGVQRIKQPFGT